MPGSSEPRVPWTAQQQTPQQGQLYGPAVDSAEESRLRGMETAVHQLLADTAAASTAGDPLTGGTQRSSQVQHLYRGNARRDATACKYLNIICGPVYWYDNIGNPMYWEIAQLVMLSCNEQTAGS